VVLHDIINNKFAHKAIEKGADGLIAVAAGAGGHAGVKSPFALVQEIRQWFDGPLALSGLHRHRRRRAGRAGHGRRLCLHRLGLHRHRRGPRQPMPTSRPSWTATADDIVYSNLFTGVHGNYLAPSIRAAGLDPDNLPESDPSKMNFGGDKSKGLEGHLGLRPGHWRRIAVVHSAQHFDFGHRVHAGHGHQRLQPAFVFSARSHHALDDGFFASSIFHHKFGVCADDAQILRVRCMHGGYETTGQRKGCEQGKKFHVYSILIKQRHLQHKAKPSIEILPAINY
jgi:hypothetical protein